MSDMRYAVTVSASEVMDRVHVTVAVWKYPSDPLEVDKRIWKRTADVEVEGLPGSHAWVINLLDALKAAL